jgi:hypothetical protein
VAIHELDDGTGFVISSHGAWLPGIYATRQAARWAFQFSDYDLAKLRDRVGRPITTDDLRERLIVTHATDNRASRDPGTSNSEKG